MALDGDKVGSVTDSVETGRVQPSHMQPYGPPAVITDKQLWYVVDETTTPAVATVYISWDGAAYAIATRTVP